MKMAARGPPSSHRLGSLGCLGRFAPFVALLLSYFNRRHPGFDAFAVWGLKQDAVSLAERLTPDESQGFKVGQVQADVYRGGLGSTVFVRPSCAFQASTHCSRR